MSTPLSSRSPAVVVSVVLYYLACGLAYGATITMDQRSVRSSGSVSSANSTETWSKQNFSPDGSTQFALTVDESRSSGSNTVASSASMDSTVTATLLAGSASVASSTISNEPAYSYNSLQSDAASSYRVTFDILEPTEFRLDGLLAVDYVLDSFYGSGSATLSLRNTNYNGPGFNLSFGSSNEFSQHIDLSGVLDPNTYTLDVLASVSGRSYNVGISNQNTAMFDFNLWLGPPASAIPLPATAWLLLTGVAGLLVRFSRRRSAP